jgi:hypothetical protein
VQIMIRGMVARIVSGHTAKKTIEGLRR